MIFNKWYRIANNRDACSQRLLEFVNNLKIDDLFVIKMHSRLNDSYEIRDNLFYTTKKNFLIEYTIAKRTAKRAIYSVSTKAYVYIQSSMPNINTLVDFYEPAFYCQDNHNIADPYKWKTFKSLDDPWLNLTLDLIGISIKDLPIFSCKIDERNEIINCGLMSIRM